MIRHGKASARSNLQSQHPPCVVRIVNCRGEASRLTSRTTKLQQGTLHKESKKPLRILLVEESPADAELIVTEVQRAGMRPVVMIVDSEDGLERALRDFRPDVVLSEHTLEKLDFRAALRVVHSLRPHTPLIVVSGPLRSEDSGSCVRAGAENFISKKNLSRLAPAISAALVERSALSKLTSRQIEIMRLIADGHRTREIADQLKVSMKTVESHRTQLMRRLGMRGMADLVRYAVRVGLANDGTRSAREPMARAG
jgi:DNA-binding NarL/FixJ family response regulator